MIQARSAGLPDAWCACLHGRLCVLFLQQWSNVTGDVLMLMCASEDLTEIICVNLQLG